MRPPFVRAEWDECSAWTQAQMIAYDQIRQIEEAEGWF